MRKHYGASNQDKALSGAFFVVVKSLRTNVSLSNYEPRQEEQHYQQLRGGHRGGWGLAAPGVPRAVQAQGAQGLDHVLTPRAYVDPHGLYYDAEYVDYMCV